MSADARITEDAAGNLVIQTSLIAKLDEIAAGQSAGFARIETAMKGKADKSDLAKLEGRLDEHGKQLAELQAWRHDREVASGVHAQRDEKVFTRRQKAWGAVAGVLTMTGIWLGPIIASAFSAHPGH